MRGTQLNEAYKTEHRDHIDTSRTSRQTENWAKELSAWSGHKKTRQWDRVEGTKLA